MQQSGSEARREREAGRIALRAGPLSMVFDSSGGFLRRIRWGEREVLRGVYAAVRDRNWETVAGVFRMLHREVHQEAFELRFEAEHRCGEIRFAWTGRLTGDAEGCLTYALEGVAQSTFLKNRVGFCVLHPIRGCAGARARQTRTDGTVVEGRFPDRIEPQIFGQASFQDLRAVAHEVAPGVWAEVSFAGDVFEMEDQRNWTDASFKTYCTPLARPFPVEIVEGTRVEQVITLRWASGKTSAAAAGVELEDRSGSTRLRWAGHSLMRLPELGVQLPLGATAAVGGSEPGAADEILLGLFRRLPLSHVRIDWRVGAPGSVDRLRRAAGRAAGWGAAIELAVHLPADGDESGAERGVWADGARVARVLALRAGESATTAATLDQVRRLLWASDLPVGVGSDSNFCELNRAMARGQLPVAPADFLFWSVTPQVHVTDDWSVMENLETQGDTVGTAREWAGGRPLWVTPVTLRPRFNPVAADPPAVGDEASGGGGGDPRQSTLFGAAWTLGSLSALTRAGVEGVTFFEVVGPRGLMPDPALRAAGDPGAIVFPLYHVLAWVAGEWQVRPILGADPAAVAVLGLVGSGGGARLLVGNLTETEQVVECGELGKVTGVQILNESTQKHATTQPEVFQHQSDEARRLAERSPSHLPSAIQQAVGLSGTGGGVVVLGPWAVGCIDFALA